MCMLLANTIGLQPRQVGIMLYKRRERYMAMQLYKDYDVQGLSLSDYRRIVMCVTDSVMTSLIIEDQYTI